MKFFRSGGKNRELGLLRQLARAWRLFLAAPSEPLDRNNLNAALVKLYQNDIKTKSILDDAGVDLGILKNPSFDIRKFLWNKNVQNALMNALGSPEGQELIKKFGDAEDGSQERARLHEEIISRFGSNGIISFLNEIPR